MSNNGTNSDRGEELLTPAEVADLFGVTPKTVTRWAEGGKLHPIRTLGGHRRYRASEIRRLLDEHSADAPADADDNRS